eukprot:gnl/TRDRNA2_/TRDRNA2_142461_c0_seq1.p1 gnl/TRDRNA2_/TRDRNA2_142461_c0~~gnl/TRDRNA2_/TRDRNA2_142461_c0_seq1.p1  ORF type:complete len:446 (-),score=70.66 gnl/TRDRNA2_/TRDRNA2_142461_c0_seq1:22-1359(-)
MLHSKASPSVELRLRICSVQQLQRQSREKSPLLSLCKNEQQHVCDRKQPEREEASHVAVDHPSATHLGADGSESVVSDTTVNDEMDDGWPRQTSFKVEDSSRKDAHLLHEEGNLAVTLAKISNSVQHLELNMRTMAEHIANLKAQYESETQWRHRAELRLESFEKLSILSNGGKEWAQKADVGPVEKSSADFADNMENSPTEQVQQWKREVDLRLKTLETVFCDVWNGVGALQKTACKAEETLESMLGHLSDASGHGVEVPSCDVDRAMLRDTLAQADALLCSISTEPTAASPSTVDHLRNRKIVVGDLVEAAQQRVGDNTPPSKHVAVASIHGGTAAATKLQAAETPRGTAAATKLQAAETPTGTRYGTPQKVAVQGRPPQVSQSSRVDSSPVRRVLQLSPSHSSPKLLSQGVTLGSRIKMQDVQLSPQSMRRTIPLTALPLPG